MAPDGERFAAMNAIRQRHQDLVQGPLRHILLKLRRLREIDARVQGNLSPRRCQ